MNTPTENLSLESEETARSVTSGGVGSSALLGSVSFPWRSACGRVTLYHADCRDVLPTLAGVDAVITDPPYGISHITNYGASWAGKQIACDQDTEARDWVASWAGELPAVFFGTWKTPPVANTRACIIWNKGPAFGMGDLSLPWKPSFEMAYICGKGWSGTRGEGVLSGPVVVSWESAGRLHPHQKPEWLMAHFIERCPEAITILDPFMGSGTTAIACIRTGRRFIGVEKDATHFATARARIEAELAQGDLFLDSALPNAQAEPDEPRR